MGPTSSPTNSPPNCSTTEVSLLVSPGLLVCVLPQLNVLLFIASTMPSIDHILLRTPATIFPKIIKSYESALAPLGVKVLANIGGTLLVFGTTGPLVVIRQVESDDAAVKFEGVHFAITVDSREEVQAFHAAALKAGWKDNGAPGLRKDIAPDWYAAFVIDEAGNNVEAVYHVPPLKGWKKKVASHLAKYAE